MYNEINGDLISLAKEGKFDVIVHGCNCFCLQGAGIALQMKNTFKSHQTPLEDTIHRGDINKLGQIDWFIPDEFPSLTVVNAYTQYNLGKDLDYNALILCLKKINHMFKGKHIGLPKIGAGIAGGVWGYIEMLIKDNLKDCKVTVVNYVK